MSDPTTIGAVGAEPTYAEYYYRHDCGLPYERNEHWSRFFGGVADAIVRELRPRTVLDVGCAMGFLVEELRVRGVEAWGIDVSEYAIANVHPSVAEFCAVSSAAAEALPEGFPESFDLVTCVEVVEHLGDDDVLPALANLTIRADRLLFSSSPLDYTEATHRNVKPTDAWSARLAGLGMWRNLDLDASFLTPWAAVYDRREPVPPDLVAGYERAYVLHREEIRSLRAEALRRHADDVKNDDAAVTVDLEAARERVNELEDQVRLLDAELQRLTVLEQDLAAERESAAAATAALAEVHAQLLEAKLAELAARDHAVGAEAGAGQLRATVKRLESELVEQRLERAMDDERIRGLHEQIDGMRAAVEHRDAMLASETWRIGAAIASPMRLFRRAPAGSGTP